MEKTIKKHADAGEKITQPDSGLLQLMHEATSWDEDQYTLTKAWEVASYVIAAHIHAASCTPNEQQKFLREQERTIRKIYQREQTAKMLYWGYTDKYGYNRRGFPEDDGW